MMEPSTFEATVRNGHIELPPDVCLPEQAKVFVVVPGADTTPSRRVASPRLANPEQVNDFTMTVAQECPDAGV